MEETNKIYGGFGDVAPENVLKKSSGSSYVVVSKTNEFIKNKKTQADLLNLDDPITRKNFIIQFCSYIKPNETKISRVNLFYGILDKAEVFNNFDAEGKRIRNPQDYINFSHQNNLRIKLAPSLPDNDILDCSDPIKLLDEEIALCPKMQEYEIFLENLYREYKNKLTGFSKPARKV